MHSSSPEMSRRNLLASAAGAAAVGLIAGRASADEKAKDDPTWKITNGRIKQSVVPWCFKPMEIETLAKAAAAMGLKSVELCDPKHFPMLKQLGLTCAIGVSHGFVKGFNHTENHATCIAKVRESIDAVASIGGSSVICFSGMREKLTNEEGIKNSVDGLKQIIGYAEEKKIDLCMEVLNSRVAEEMKGHPDYQADTIEWGVEVCKKVGSPRMKLLFDIYHVQIMQGDVITRIRQFKEYIGHYHTAGVPGRNELDDTQEINYPPIIKAIIETGYTGYLGQEFIPRNEDKIASLRQGARLCDV